MKDEKPLDDHQEISYMSNRNQIVASPILNTELILTYKYLSPYNRLTPKGLLIKLGHKLKFLSVLVGVKSHHYIVTRKRQHKGK